MNGLQGCVFRAGQGALENQPSPNIGPGRQGMKRYRKELVHLGRYRHPESGKAFDVTAKSLTDWEREFGRMKANGVKVPVVLTHAGAQDPDKNRGWLQDVFVEGGALIGMLDLIGEDADRLAATTDVSIHSPQSFVDGKGNAYSWPILHVALCTDPLVPGLSGFVAVAASLGGAATETAVYKLDENGRRDPGLPARIRQAYGR